MKERSPIHYKLCVLRRTKIRLIEGGNANRRHLNKLTCKWTLRHVIICLRPRTPYPQHLTLCIRVYSICTYSHREWRGEGWRVEPERKGEGQQFTKLSRKYQETSMSVSSNKCTEPIMLFCLLICVLASQLIITFSLHFLVGCPEMYRLSMYCLFYGLHKQTP